MVRGWVLHTPRVPPTQIFLSLYTPHAVPLRGSAGFGRQSKDCYALSLASLGAKSSRAENL